MKNLINLLLAFSCLTCNAQTTNSVYWVNEELVHYYTQSVCDSIEDKKFRPIFVKITGGNQISMKLRFEQPAILGTIKRSENGKYVIRLGGDIRGEILNRGESEATLTIFGRTINLRKVQSSGAELDLSNYVESLILGDEAQVLKSKILSHFERGKLGIALSDKLRINDECFTIMVVSNTHTEGWDIDKLVLGVKREKGGFSLYNEKGDLVYSMIETK